MEFQMNTEFSQRPIVNQLLCKIFLLLIVSYCLVPGRLYGRQVSDDLLSVSFANERDGWACGRWGTVVHTTDGGNTWTPQASGTDYTLSTVFFVDPQHGWAVGDEGIIIHSKDGGKNWRKQVSPVPFALMDVYFANPLRGWIVTERTHILSTDDGGKTWAIEFCDEDFILKAISFADSLHGWAVGEYGYIYHTSDGGVTWKKQAGSFELSTRTGRPEGGTFLFDVRAIDPQRAWAVGIDGYVIKTEDGGESWQKVKTGAPKAKLFCITSEGANRLLIGGKGIFLSSDDGGKTWTVPKFTPPISYGWLYGLAQRGASGFVAVGWNGAIYINTSNTWQRVNY